MARRPPKNGEIRKKIKHTLLVDGNSLFKVSYHGAKDVYNLSGEHIGGIFQFLTQLRKQLNEHLYHQVYVFWDGTKSGKLRWQLYKAYKGNRNKDFINGTKPQDDDEKNQLYQKMVIESYLDELFIRQFSDPEVESDDFIAYFCNNRKEEEKITIMTGDGDLCQLIDDDVRIFFLKTGVKPFITPENYTEHFNHHLENVLLYKMLMGDTSDNIKGVKGLGKKKLMEFFPEIVERPLTLEYVIEKAKKLNDERVTNKKSRLKVLDNVINGVTDGVQGDRLYEINKKIINLKEPLVTDSSISELNILMESEFVLDDMNIKNTYLKLKDDGIHKILGEDKFTDYLFPFKKLMEREKNNII